MYFNFNSSQLCCAMAHGGWYVDTIGHAHNYGALDFK